MTLDAFRTEAAGWLGRDAEDLVVLAWKHDPGGPPEACSLDEAVALALPRAEYDPGQDDGVATEAPAWAATPEPLANGTEPCSLHEVMVVHTLAQHVLGWSGAVVASSSGRSWNLYREA